MLLSMYVSFRLSSDLAEERLDYVLLMTGFIIVASFLSTFVSILKVYLIVLYPFSLVSFPFFSISKLSHGDLGFLTGYDISFFGMEIGSISAQDATLYCFSIFLLINLVGVMLGYWINKKLAEGSLEWNLLNFLFRSGFWSFLICYAIVWLAWFASSLIVWYGVDGIWFIIVSNTMVFCKHFFWIPATIATAIYGIYKWSKSRKQYSAIV